MKGYRLLHLIHGVALYLWGWWPEASMMALVCLEGKSILEALQLTCGQVVL